MTYERLKLELQDGVATVTLNRPDARNAIDLRLAKELHDVALRCDDDPEARAVVLTGAGDMFCVGGDLKEFHRQGDNAPRYIKELTSYLHAAVARLSRMDPPVIAAVNGTAAGAGLSLACLCDLVFAVESARFVMAYTRAGLTPDGSSTYFLPRAVGLRRALELTLTNRSLSAEEARDWGLVTRVVSEANLRWETHETAAQLAAGPTLALGAAKRLLHRAWTETLESQMEQETQAIARMAASADGREGISAFVEKRDPDFTGR